MVVDFWYAQGCCTLLTSNIAGHALNRETQLPELATSVGSTSGIWAPALREHNGTFYLLTTMVHDKKADNDSSRWDNVRCSTLLRSSLWLDTAILLTLIRSSFQRRTYGTIVSGVMRCILTSTGMMSVRTGMMRETRTL